MKKLIFVLFALIAGINLNTKAEDFSSVYNDDTIYYNITSSVSPRTIKVTYKGTSYNSYVEYYGPISIPDSVIYNGNYYKVTSIGEQAFSDCNGLTSIVIPNSVISIGVKAFWGCRGLISVSIPNSVTLIGENAFHYTSYYNNKSDGLVYINNILYKYKGSMPTNTTISIRNGTINISDNAFLSCINLNSIKIPPSVTSIGNSAFANCTGLASIIIPNSVTLIGNSAFANCTGLTSIIIPNSVTSIGNGTFYGCKKLTSIKIPPSVSSIGNNTFESCSNLTSITIPSSIVLIGDYAFHYCSKLTSIIIPASVTLIGNHAFHSCTSLTSISIPASVSSIGDGAFANCTGLTSITCNATNPPLIQWSSFDLVNEYIPVYVPCSSLSNYMSTMYWGKSGEVYKNKFNNFYCITGR